MRYRKLDADGDMVVGRNAFWTDVPEAVAQAIQTRLRLWQGEWFLDVTAGTPWAQGGLGARRRATVGDMVRQRILGSEGVLALDEFTMTDDGDTRRVTIRATASTRYGDAAVTETI